MNNALRQLGPGQSRVARSAVWQRSGLCMTVTSDRDASSTPVGGATYEKIDQLQATTDADYAGHERRSTEQPTAGDAACLVASAAKERLAAAFIGHRAAHDADARRSTRDGLLDGFTVTERRPSRSRRSWRLGASCASQQSRTSRPRSATSSVTCEQLEVLRRDHPLGQRPLARSSRAGRASTPRRTGRPGSAHLVGLDQRQRLEQLVERAEAAGEDDEALGRLHEHHLARVEVLEGERRCRGTGSAPARAGARC